MSRATGGNDWRLTWPLCWRPRPSLAAGGQCLLLLAAHWWSTVGARLRLFASLTDSRKKAPVLRNVPDMELADAEWTPL